MKKVGTTTATPSAKLRKFSDIQNSEKIMKKILSSSRSGDDAKSRISAYTKAFSNFGELEGLRTRKQSSGLGDLSGLQPNQFVDVTVTTMISSITGFFAVERGVDAPFVKMPFLNLLNSETDAMVSPNIGADNNLASSKISISSSTPATAATLGGVNPIIPNSLKITVKRGAATYILKDDGLGAIVGPFGAGLVSGTSINYSTGAIVFTLGVAFDSYNAEWFEDAPKDPTNKTKPALKYYDLNCTAEVLLSETNLVTNLVAQKSMNIPINDILKRRLLEEYVKMTNSKIVNAINLGYVGGTTTIDLSDYNLASSATFETLLNVFTHGLNKVDTQLTDKSYKSVTPSAYLVGKKVAELFKSCNRLGSFVANTESTYIEDLLGYFNGVPVIKTHRIDQWTAYASHKTSDGQLAPAARAIFLPVNDLPEVGNFNNPTQSAGGIYSYEGTTLLTSELLQKFVIVPADVVS